MGLAELLEAVEAGFDDVEAAGVAEADGVIGTEGDATTKALEEFVTRVQKK